MIKIKKSTHKRIAPLCVGNEDVVLLSCLEGNIGEVWVDNSKDPTCAIAIVADFCFLLGDANEAEGEMFQHLLTEKCRNRLINIKNDQWISKLSLYFQLKTVTRYKLEGTKNIFNIDKLKNFVSNVEQQFSIMRIDEELFQLSLQDDFTADFCCFFSNYDDFSQNGIGYVIVENEKIIAGASSYTYCKGKIDITIGTIEEYRRKGLGLACAAKLILDCLENDIYPVWDAANQESVALAEKLGYKFHSEYLVYRI